MKFNKLILLLFIPFLCACSSNSIYDSSREKDQLNAIEKYYSGQQMTQEEYDYAKGFDSWKQKQGSHTRSEWDTID